MTRRVLWTAGTTGPGETTLIVATETHTYLDMLLDPGTLDPGTLDVAGIALDPAEVTGLRDALNAWLADRYPAPTRPSSQE